MFSAIVERILEELRRLTPDERRQLREALTRKPRPAHANNMHEQGRAWFEQNRNE